MHQIARLPTVTFITATVIFSSVRLEDANIATTVGYSVKYRPGLKVFNTKNTIYLVNPGQVKAPIIGSVRLWKFYASDTGLLYLQVWRHYKFSNNVYTLVNQTSTYVLNTGTKEVPSAIKIQKNDVIGFYSPDRHIVGMEENRNCSSLSTYYQYGKGLYVGKPVQFLPIDKGCFYFAIQATIEGITVPGATSVPGHKAVSTGRDWIVPVSVSIAVVIVIAIIVGVIAFLVCRRKRKTLSALHSEQPGTTITAGKTDNSYVDSPGTPGANSAYMRMKKRSLPEVPGNEEDTNIYVAPDEYMTPIEIRQ